MSDADDKAKIRQWLQGGMPKKGAGAPDSPTGGGDPAWYTQVGRGLARGVASDIPGLSTSKFATQDDAGPIETGARWAGEYGSLLVPGLDFGLGAKFGTKAAEWALEHGPSIQALAKAVGPQRAQQMIHGLWETAPKAGATLGKGAVGGVMADPEHPLQGATTGALTSGVVGAIPKGVKKYATTAAAAGTGLAAWDAMRQGHGENLPAYFAARHAISPLATLAATTALHRPALAGAAGSGARRLWVTREGDDDGQNQ